MKPALDPSSLSKGYRGKRKKPTGRTPDENLLTHLVQTAKKDPKRTALLASSPGPKTSLSYGELLDRVEKICCGLKGLGIKKGDRIAVLSENRQEWTMADLSIMAVGAVTVPIHTSLSPQQLGYQLKNSRAKLVFLSDGPHVQSLNAIRDKLPALKGLVFFGETLPEGYGAPDLSLRNLLDLGERDRRPMEIMASRVAARDPATIVYTSGTNNQWPKGVLLTHENFLAEKKAVASMLLLQQGDVLLSFLPLSHILQRVVDMVTLLEGCTLAYCADMDTVPDKLIEFRPNLLVGVPRTYEKIRNLIMENLLYSAPPLKELYQRIFRWMENEYLAQERGTKRPAGPGMPVQWMKKRAVRKIRERMGSRLRCCFSAGAPLPRELEAFFEIIQMPLYNVYGMTELTGAVTANCPDRHKPGTVGVPLRGCELRVAEDGEILVRGSMVMDGYYRPGKPPENATDGEGWFATGDLGRFDSDGFLVITGRKKELLITAAGKNISPQPIESRLRRNPYVQQTMVIGDGRQYLTALIVPTFSRLEALANRKRILFMNRERLLEHPKIRELYREIVEDLNKDLSRFETLKRCALLPERFTQEAGELTPTNRLRRQIIERHYRKEISEMYWGQA
jgi:long-chain acyl-CoA synthetase